MIADVEDFRSGTADPLLDFRQITTEEDFVLDAGFAGSARRGIKVGRLTALCDHQVEEVEPFGPPFRVASQNGIHHRVGVFPLTVGQQEHFLSTLPEMKQQSFSTGVLLNVCFGIGSNHTLQGVVPVNGVSVLADFFPDTAPFPRFRMIDQRGP